MNRESGKSSADERDFLQIRKFVREDDMRAFDALVLNYQDLVFNLCYRMMGDYDDARDCAQETFYKAYRSLRGFRFESSFSTWIYRIAVNTCKNSLSRAHRRKESRSARGENGNEGPLARSDPGGKALRPDEIYEKKELERMLQEAISSLPDELRPLVILKDIDEKTYEEIAEILDMKSGTVKSRLSRARQILREQLRGIIGNEL